MFDEAEEEFYGPEVTELIKKLYTSIRGRLEKVIANNGNTINVKI